MTKDLALLVGVNQRWLSATGFLDKVQLVARWIPSLLATTGVER